MHMQAIELRKLAGCTEADRKAWLRAGVLVPVKSGAGAGVNADFDAANVIAAAVAQQMKNWGVTVKVFQAAFVELQTSLRARSALDWPYLRLAMSPTQAALFPDGDSIPSQALVFDLEPFCLLLGQIGDGPSPQRPLPFGLQVAG